ncbi:MAG: VWA domain-containing protein [Thermoanaerobaculia bacterium]|nr:VWA domain-containing protein [Thermoanaerobaculia bacterium]
MKRLVLTIAAILLTGLPMQAQEALTPTATDSISVNYVLVPFVVFNEYGTPIRNLRERDVQLMVDGESVDLDFFERSHDAPVSFTILLDASGSMALGGKMEGARKALEALIRQKNPGDDYTLYSFSQGEVRHLVPFTGDGERILEAFDRVEPYGKTALFDALRRMPDKTILGSNGARAIILLSDGLDNASKIDRSQLADILRGVSVPVFPLSLRTPEAALAPDLRNNREAKLDLAVLAAVAGASGGRLAITQDPKYLGRAVDNILEELRSQYLLGFSPSGRGGVRYRAISLNLKRPVGVVRIRSGYLGTAPH